METFMMSMAYAGLFGGLLFLAIFAWYLGAEHMRRRRQRRRPLFLAAKPGDPIPLPSDPVWKNAAH